MGIWQSITRHGLALGLLPVCLAWMGAAVADDRPQAQIVFETDYRTVVDEAAKVQEDFETTKNEIAHTIRRDANGKKDEALRGPRTVDNWTCQVEEILERSTAYDVRLRTGRKPYYLAVCASAESGLRYLVLYDRSEPSRQFLARARAQKKLTFSGTLGAFPEIATFHSKLLPPTFIARARL